jgi:hypothetical protein
MIDVALRSSYPTTITRFTFPILRVSSRRYRLTVRERVDSDHMMLTGSIETNGDVDGVTGASLPVFSLTYSRGQHA